MRDAPDGAVDPAGEVKDITPHSDVIGTTENDTRFGATKPGTGPRPIDDNPRL
jgi:hypothetical protein